MAAERAAARHWTARAKSLAMAQWTRSRDFAIAGFIVGTLAIMLMPLSAFVMDLLLGLNLMLGLVLLMTTVFVNKPLDFSTFPSLLLIVTLYRLSLNIATTRLILSRGHLGKHAAGDLIATFGSFVSGGGESELGGLVIGLTIFTIITLIQFIVITKGATRIAEVAARFTLDSLPGKQMAIEAALNSGEIKEEEARKQREEVQQLTDFYGSMDGASKFVRGDSIASIIITIVNIAVGFVVGMLIYGQSATDAAITYTTLTIGDGLVSQIPALLISIGSGLLVTRSSSKKQFGVEITGQLFGQAKSLAVATLILGLLGFSGLAGLSPFPPVPLLFVAAGTGVAWYGMKRGNVSQAKAERAQAEEKAQTEEKAKPEAERIEDYLRIDAMQLEVGYSVVALVDSPQGDGGGGLLARVGLIRNQLATEMGIIVPRIRIRDNITLEPNQYVIKIQGQEVARGTAEPDKYLAMDTGAVTGAVPGKETIEPAFGMPAVWIEPTNREYAERLGYTVVDVETVVTTHLTEVIKSRAADLLTGEETRRLLDATKEYAPGTVQEMESSGFPVSSLQRVLQNLLRERVSIRNMPIILETLSGLAKRVQDTDILTEYVRMALARWLCNAYAENNHLYVVAFDPALEEAVAGRIERTDAGTFLVLRPAATHRLVEAIAKEVQRQMQMGHQALVMVAPQIRRQVRQITTASMPQLVVMSQNEIIPEVMVQSCGMVQCDLN